MSDRFDTCLPLLLNEEGGYVDDPRDHGGATNLGVTLGVAQEYGLDLDHDGDVDKADVRRITVAEAAPVYREGYWDACLCGRLPAGVDRLVFDSAVNCGSSRARKWLQTALGVKPDGVLGSATMAALGHASPRLLVEVIASLRKAHYQRQSNFATYGRGWTSRLDDIRNLAAREAAALPNPNPQGVYQ